MKPVVRRSDGYPRTRSFDTRNGVSLEMSTVAGNQSNPCWQDLSHTVLLDPSELFTKTLSVPMVVPYIWYQNVNLLQVVGAISGL